MLFEDLYWSKTSLTNWCNTSLTQFVESSLKLEIYLRRYKKVLQFLIIFTHVFCATKIFQRYFSKLFTCWYGNYSSDKMLQLYFYCMNVGIYWQWRVHKFLHKPSTPSQNHFCNTFAHRKTSEIIISSVWEKNVCKFK